MRMIGLMLLWVLCGSWAGGQGLGSRGAMEAGEHRIRVNGVELWYKVAGKRRPGVAPMVYLAGGPGYNSFSFEATAGPAMERLTEMIYLDERGTGRSERPASRDYRMSTLVGDLEQLRVALGEPQLTLMGQSFGAAIALAYADAHPDRVQKLMVIDGAVDMVGSFAIWDKEVKARYPAAWTTAMGGAAGAAVRAAEGPCAVTQARFALDEAVLQTVDSGDFHHWQQFHNQRFEREQERIDAGSGLKNTGEMEGAFFTPGNAFLCSRFTDFARLTMPVLVVVGRYDGSVGVEPLRRFAEQLPRGTFVEFQRSAHFPYAEEPARFARVVGDFLAR